MEYPKFRIELDSPSGRNARVYINDEDWSSVLTGLEIRIDVGDLTRVNLEMIAGNIYFDGPAAASIATQVLEASGLEIQRGEDEADWPEGRNEDQG